jgi:hypothetical protein
MQTQIILKIKIDKKIKQYLSKRSLANERIDLVAVEELFAVFDDVVVVVVIIAVIVQLSLFFVRRVFTLRLLRSPLFLCVINLHTQKQKINFKFALSIRMNFRMVEGVM